MGVSALVEHVVPSGLVDAELVLVEEFSTHGKPLPDPLREPAVDPEEPAFTYGLWWALSFVVRAGFASDLRSLVTLGPAFDRHEAC